MKVSDLVWLVGLLAILGVVALYAERQHRARRQMAPLNPVPLTVALYAALAIFAAGLAITAFQSGHEFAWWLTALWVSVAFLCLLRAVATLTLQFRPQGFSAQPPGETSRGDLFWMLMLALPLVGIATILSQSGISLLGSPAVTSTEAGPTAVLRESRAVPTPIMQFGGESDDITPLATTAPVAQTLLPEQSGEAVTPQVEPILIITPTPVPQAPSVLLPTPTPVASASTAPVPTTVSALSTTVTVTSPVGVNARVLPNRAAQIITILPENTQIVAVGRTEDGSWLLTTLDDGARAWVATDYLETDRPWSELPLIRVTEEP